jgi:hypothetical protein
MCPAPETLDPGRLTIRRLNRFEYNNTVRDLLDDATKPADDFPADDFGHGFNNLSDVLSTAPVLVEKYDRAAQALAAAVVEREASQGQGQTTRIEAESAVKSTGAVDGPFWNLYSNGTISSSVNFVSSGMHTFNVRAGQSKAGSEDAQMTLSLDGKNIGTFTVSALRSAPATFTAQSMVTAGSHRVEIEFINDYFAAPDDRNLYVDWFEVQRPGSTINVANAKVMVCDPVAQGATCVRTILTNFGRKAWRRPLTQAEVARYELVFTKAQGEQEPVKSALTMALGAMLLSPNFLYRVELDPAPTSLEPHPVSAHELAARLSYFLWASTPDDALSRAADDGSLLQPGAAEMQVERMLKDAKAKTLVTQFGGQWLWSNQVEEAAPSASIYANVTAATKSAMRQQTEALVDHYLTNDESALDLLGAPFTYLNDTLADHYGLPKPGSTTMQRVNLGSAEERGSLLGNGGILTVTSFPTRTSPVKRGAWVLSNVLCQEPPAPPPGVEALPIPSNPTSSLRERVEAHRNKPMCSGCHSLMDPIGFGLESFDGVGRMRTMDTGGFPIDASGTLPTGQAFNGPKELTHLLKGDARVPHCMTEKMFTYGLGRPPTKEETCQIDGITHDFAQRGHRLAGLVKAIVGSRMFTHRRGEPTP